LLWRAWKKFKLVYTYLEIQEASMTSMLLILTSWLPKGEYYKEIYFINGVPNNSKNFGHDARALRFTFKV